MPRRTDGLQTNVTIRGVTPKAFEVRGECYLSKENFERHNAKADGKKIKKLVNCRNGAAGAIRQKDPKVTKARRIQFMAFGVTETSFTDLDDDTDVLDYLESLGFQTVKHFVIGNQPQINASIFSGG